MDLPFLCEFDVVEEPCYFCGQLKTIKTNEHYVFCPNCMAIYTTMIIQESNCEHIRDGVPYVEHGPMTINHKWVGGELKRYAPGIFEKPFIWEDGEDLYKEGGDSTIQRCSKCHAECVVDGW